MFSSSIPKLTEEVLDEVLRIIKDDQGMDCLLFETDRKNYVEQEESLRKHLKEINDSVSTSSLYSLRRLIGLPPPQAPVCLENAERLRKRVKDEINERRRRSILTGSSQFGSSMGARTADRQLLVDDTSRPANEIVTSPLNMRCSISEVSGSNVDPASNDGSDIGSDMDAAMSTPFSRPNNPMSDFYNGLQPGRMSPSPSFSPPFVQAVGSSIPETPSSPRRPRSFRESPLPSPQPKRQSRVHSPHSPGVPSVMNFPQEPETYTRQRLSANEDYTSKINCLDIRGSTAYGITLNNGGTNNSGAVIHEMNPQRFRQNIS